jgi:hypothetical protein
VRLVGPLLAEVGSADRRGVHDGPGARGVEQPGERRVVRELDEHGARTGGRGVVPVRGHHVVPARVEERGEAAAQQAARAGDEDAGPSSP